MTNTIKLGSKVKVIPGEIGYEFVRDIQEEFGAATLVGILDKKTDHYRILFDTKTDFVQSYMFYGNELEVISPPPRGWKHPNAPTLERVKLFVDNLHGSGINYNWKIEETNTSFRASNAFDILNGDGFYEATVKFTVIFPKKASMYDFNIQFGSGSQYQARKHIIREYLESTMMYAIEVVR